jgi:putative addiction module component (TIGR02574 family)
MLFDIELKAIVRENGKMIAERIPALKNLSLEEKLILAGELWDELAQHPNGFPSRDDHVKLLQERLEHYKQNPHDIVSWESVKARILSAR